MMKRDTQIRLEALGAAIIGILVVLILLVVSDTQINWALQVERTPDEYRRYCWNAPCMSPIAAIAFSLLLGVPILFAGIIAAISDHEPIKRS